MTRWNGGQWAWLVGPLTLALGACGGDPADPGCPPDAHGGDDDASTTAAVTTPAAPAHGLSLEEFNDGFMDRYCSEWEACTTTTDLPCPLPEWGAEDSGYRACEFDPSAGERCLYSHWSCNTVTPGREYVVTPQACIEVCRGAE